MASWSSLILHVFIDSMDNKYGVMDLLAVSGADIVIGSLVMGSMESGVEMGIVMISDELVLI